MFVRENNNFVSNTVNIQDNNNYYNYGLTQIIPSSIADNGIPSIPSTYLLGSKSRIDNDAIIYSSSSGLILQKSKVHGPTIIPFEYEGDSGTGVAQGVAFCTNTFPTGASSTIVITTAIPWRPQTAILIYRFYITDNSNNYLMCGTIYGDTVVPAVSNGKTITVAQGSNGNIQISLSSFNNTAGNSGLVGTIRHA
jgi:hypothetical protein